MRIIFMGTPEFAVPTLEALIQGGHEVAAVVTQPDKPKGRGGKMQFPPVKECALQHEIHVLQPVKVREKEVVDQLAAYQPDAIVVVAFGQILPKEILDMPKYGCINVHASLLPKYRGAAPMQWAIIDGEKKTGITTMYMNEGLDTGDILEQEETEITEDETAQTLHDRLSMMGGPLILSTLDKLEKNEITRIKQDDSQSCYAKMLHKSLGNICFDEDAESIERLIRGLNPWPSAFTHLNGKTLKIWRAQTCESNFDAKPGTIVKVEKDSFTIACKKGGLEVLSLQLEGKKRMDAENFLRGYQLEEGIVLGE